MDEVYFSGVSASTKTSTIEHKSACKAETESLEAQLDRLNFTLVSLLKPEDEYVRDSFSFQDSNETENSLESEWKSLVSEDNSEQLRMMCEDFRSHELRSNQKSLSKISIKCELSELYHLYSNLASSIDSIEKNLTKTAEITLKNIQIRLLVKPGFYLPKKESLSLPLNKPNFQHDIKAYVRQLENEIEELRYQKFHWNSASQLDDLMLNSYNDSFTSQSYAINLETNSCNLNQFSSLPSKSSLDFQTKLADSLNKTRKNLLSELDWEVSTTKMLKSTYEAKLNELAQKEQKLSRQVKEINQEVIKKMKNLEKERSKVLRDSEKIKSKSDLLQVSIRNLKGELKLIQDNLETEKVLTIQIPTPCATPCATPKHEPAEDVATIEAEIRNLENSLKTAADKSSVEFRINKLRTRLSTLRSARMLNTCTNQRRVSAFAKGNNLPTSTTKGNVFNFNIPLENIAATPRCSARSNTCFTNRGLVTDLSPMTTDRNPVESYAKEENLSQTLELKDARLRRKEEDILKQEIRLQETWMKLPNANELIPIVRHEIEKYIHKHEELKKSQSELDSLIRQNLENMKKNKDIEEENIKNTQDLKEKIKTAEKIKDVLKKFEEVLI